MPTACHVYYTVYTVRERLRVFLAGASKPQLTNLSLLTFGLFAAGNCRASPPSCPCSPERPASPSACAAC